MSYNMWGSAKADPPQQQESEDQNLTHEQRMAKYPKPMVAFDRDGVLFETDGTPIKREDAVPIVDAFKAIAMIRRKGYKIAMICDQPGLNANLITHEEVELGNAYVIELLGQYGCPSIDCILYNEGNEKQMYWCLCFSSIFQYLFFIDSVSRSSERLCTCSINSLSLPRSKKNTKRDK